MKNIIITLMSMFLCCNIAQAKVVTITERDANGNKKREIELCDTIKNGRHTIDTISITTFENEPIKSYGTQYQWEFKDDNSDSFFKDINQGLVSGSIIAITAIILIFGFPIFIIFIIFYYRNKNRTAKYRLMEQALAAGQPLPAEFFKGMEPKSTLNKGIKNICLGIGLFIMLWGLTGEFGLGCIGLLIMFTGIGQVTIHYLNNTKNNDKTTHRYNTSLQHDNEEETR